ncbi:MAG TPA: ATP-binding protein, partial [Acidimicrobiales bacterium]|nr:ATP-binding protein [Acidimicrobiales bacterium]
KTNLERFTRMLQGQRDLAAASSMILSELAPLVSAQHGVFYSLATPAGGGEPVLELQAGYGFEERRRLSTSFKVGEGLVGQCAKERKRILLTEVPADYVRINSGLGAATPLNIIVLPVLFEGSVRAVVELASFSTFSLNALAFLDQLPESIGLVLNTIEANTLTEKLLERSQSLAEELRESNEDLERQAALLAEQNIEAQNRNREIEQSKRLVEEKAGQLSASSKYKSEFIANMSHELRTPLNSLLILAEQLESNPDGNMTATQVEYATVIRTSGKDLMGLLNGILDLAKVESGTVTVDIADVSLDRLCAAVHREFEHVALTKGVAFSVDLAPDAPATIATDSQRLRQVLTNLLANAFKFTHHGRVQVEIGAPPRRWQPVSQPLAGAPSVVAFRVSDTGIGIPLDQQQRIFEAFAQGDGATERLYGGTGLGLSISRELVGLLGGEINVESTPGEGSVFTFFLPGGPASPPPSSARPEVVVTPAERRARQAAPEDHDFDGANVLVVDDDFRNIFAMTALLERGNAVVTVAESGHDALDLLERTPGIDLVLMDIMMPIMDGYATIRAIRADPRFTTLPIIAVTGKVVPGERQRCLDAGADDFIPKPIETAELLAVLRPWLHAGMESPGPPSKRVDR